MMQPKMYWTLSNNSTPSVVDQVVHKIVVLLIRPGGRPF